MKILSLSTPISPRTGAIESINFMVETDRGVDQHSIAADHPNFEKAKKAVGDYTLQTLTNEALAHTLLRLADLLQDVSEKIDRIPHVLDGRMTIEHGRLFVDGEAIDPALEAYVLRMLREDGTPRDMANWTAFSRFLAKLYSNTSEYVREQLFGWLQYENTHREGFTIAADGDIIGYKGCGGTVDAPMSINRGTAVVNGVRHTGQIPNPLGAIVEMRKSDVEDNPAVGCAPGLHVGTYNYASGWSRGVLLKVKFSPAYVVSVPNECDAQKARVFRYEVLEVIEGPDNGLVHYDDEDMSEEGWTAEPRVTHLEDLFQKAWDTNTPVSFTHMGNAVTGEVSEVWDEDGEVWVTLYDDDEDYALADISNAKLVDLSVADTRRIFEEAIEAGEDVSYTYYSRERTVTPVRVWTDPANEREKVEVLEDGERKTFVFERMSNVRWAGQSSQTVEVSSESEEPEANTVSEPVVEATTDTETPTDSPEAEETVEEKPKPDSVKDGFKFTTGDPMVDEVVDFAVNALRDLFKKPGSN